jgi:hypothetical protein
MSEQKNISIYEHLNSKKNIFTDMNILNSFVDKNIDILLNIKVRDHPPNRTNIRKWIEKHKDEHPYDYMVANVIANNILYVTLDTVLDKFRDLANDLELLTRARDDKPLIYFGDDGIFKSNFFFTTLFYSVCRLKNIQFERVVRGGISGECRNRLVVVVDDASYSGIQLSDHIESLLCNNTTVFVAVPYVSSVAENEMNRVVKNNSQLIISNSVTRFQSVDRLFTEYLKSMNINDEIKIPYSHISNKHLLYFNFKIPDGVSIPHNIFIFGYRVSGNEEYKSEDEVLCFLTDCEDTYKTLTKNMIHNRNSDRNNRLPTNMVCPEVFYKKKLGWNFNL